MNDFEILDHTLDRERDVLLNGQLHQLSEILSEKERVFSAISTLNAPIPKSLSQKLKRNQELLHASAQGIQSVRRKLSEFRHVRDCLSFYGPNGAKHEHTLDGARRLFKRT